MGRKKNTEPMHTLQIRMSQDDREKLGKHAEAEGLTMAAFIRRECIIRKQISIEIDERLLKTFTTIKTYLNEVQDPEKAIETILKNIEGSD